MFSGVRDAIIQNDRLRYAAIHIPSRNCSLIHIPGSLGTPETTGSNQGGLETAIATSGQYPLVPIPSSLTTTGVQQE